MELLLVSNSFTLQKFYLKFIYRRFMLRTQTLQSRHETIKMEEGIIRLQVYITGSFRTGVGNLFTITGRMNCALSLAQCCFELE